MSKDQKIVAISCTKNEQDAIVKCFRYSPIALELAEKNIYPTNSEFLKLSLLFMMDADKKKVMKYFENVTEEKFQEYLLSKIYKEGVN